MIIAIDFDGTIAVNKYPAIGELMPGAAVVIKALADAGHYLILNTCRANDDLERALNYCSQHGIVFDRVNDNHPEMTATHYPTRKVFADVYIDDRNFGGFPGWKAVADLLLNENSRLLVELNKRTLFAFGCGYEALHAHTRKREIVEARQICMWWLCYNSKLSTKKIGAIMGGFDHATVLHARNTVNALLRFDAGVKKQVERFLNID